VEYIKKDLWTQKEGSRIFGITERSVNRIWSKYKFGGKRPLNNKKRGVRERKKLNGQQSAEIHRQIKDKLPDQLKLAYGL
jgi:hypothetical protein